MIRKKLIEVSIPLEAINKASAKEKSIRHGHPSTLHLWWARRPLAACRAVLFAQLVDDPSAWPLRFETEQEQDAERKRLHRIIERLVPWEASNDETVLAEARWEIARSVAWGLGEEPPSPHDGALVHDYLQAKAPPIYDPFSGGGSIPLEAQRLGLRAYGSDLNPVAVLIGKALVEIPPKFACQPPVNLVAQEERKNGALRGWKGAQGLAEDVRYYGAWMREEAVRRIGHLYPPAILPDGSKVTVVAWLWARTVRSPDPAAKGAMVPLVTSFMLSTKANTKSWAELIVDPHAQDGYRFAVHSGDLSKIDEERLSKGTKTGRSGFACALTGAAIPFDYVRTQAVTQGLGSRLMAMVVEGGRSRSYRSPDPSHETLVVGLNPGWGPDELVTTPSHDVDRLPMYGMPRWRDAFTPRQLIAITTFFDLVAEAREKVVLEARASGRDTDTTPLHANGTGAAAYGDAVATYLAFAVDKAIDRNTTLCSWESKMDRMRNTFGRQALTMVWDFAETNPLSGAGGDIAGTAMAVYEVLAKLSNTGFASISNVNASTNTFSVGPVVISTDPPYYDNIGYAELSDFFYVWLRHSVDRIWPDLFRRLITPKDDELVATPYRHGGRERAEAFFMKGMSEALLAMRKAATENDPLVIYYAFKQAEAAEGGVTSAGWASFLQAIVEAGLIVDGTWPIRTELANRMIGSGTNALASSIVLVCRKRSPNAVVVTRADLLRALRREMPDAIDNIRKAGVGPVDMQQSIIGPGMGVFTGYAGVLEDDDSTMSVRTALVLINRVWEEIENELDGAFDPGTQVALAWFSTYGFDAKPSGELITLANAKNIPLEALFSSGIFQNFHGRAGLIPRIDLASAWTPIADKEPTVWECVQHTARVLGAADGGSGAAAVLVGQMGRMAADARKLAYRLFEIATKKGWAGEALIYNELAEEWPHLEDLAPNAATRGVAKAQTDMFQEAAR